MRFLRERIELICLLAILALLVVPKKSASNRQLLAQTLIHGSATIPMSQAQARQSELPKMAIESVPCAEEGCLHRVEAFAVPADWVPKNLVGLTENPQELAAISNLPRFEKRPADFDARAFLARWPDR
jgi:hypothetical protein